MAENWLIIVVAVIIIAIVAAMLLRPRQSVRLTDGGPVRPHMAHLKNLPEGRGIAGEAAAATSDITGQLIGAPVHRELDGDHQPADDFTRMKGVGPKFADALHAIGFRTFGQLASLSPTELARIDPQLGAFAGRLSRDRVVEQADYLARNDVDGYEQRFGRL